jgi:hypothetical protein
MCSFKDVSVFNYEHKIRDREIWECLERKNVERKNNGKGEEYKRQGMYL